MSPSRTRDLNTNRHARHGVLLDARLHLLAIGPALYGGTSPKNTLDVIARRHLPPRLHEVSLTRQAITEQVEDLGGRWTVRVEPILGAKTGNLIGLLGGYWRAQQKPPRPMLVGCWELLQTPPGPARRMAGYWSPSLYTVHDMAMPPGDGPQGMAAPQWLDELVVESDRAEVRLVQDDLATATSDALRLITFRIRSPRTGRAHRLRSALWRDLSTPGPDIWLHGITMRVGDLERGPDSRPAATRYLEAMFALTRDPLCAIDSRYEQIFLTSAQFAQLNIALPAHRHLPQLCHPEDMPALRAMLNQATANPNTPIGPVPVRFRSAFGQWTTLELTGAGIWPSPRRPCYVLCRISTDRQRTTTP